MTTNSVLKYILIVVAKYLILNSVLLSQGVIRPISAQFSRECLHTASCWMALGDLRWSLNMTYKEFYDQAKPFIQKHKEFLQSQSREVEINMKCAEDTIRCQAQLKSDAASLGPTRPPGLVNDCSADTLNYMLLLCASDRPGHWPQYIYDAIVPNYPTCETACDHKMTEYHAYHLANGKTYPQDFPQSWGSRLEEEKQELGVQTTNSNPNARERGRAAGAEDDKMSTNDLKRTAFLYLEAGDRFIREEAHNENRDEKLINLICKHGTWITKVKDSLSELIFPYCNGPNKEDQSNNFLNPNTSQLEKEALEQDPFKFNSKWWDCREQRHVLPKIPGGFSFMTGVKFVSHAAKTIDVIDVGNWLCGGWAEWTGYYKDVPWEETHVLNCPHLTAMCSIQYAPWRDSEGKARLVSYIKIGCCEVPWSIFYAATNFIISDIINEQRLFNWVSPRKSMVDGWQHIEAPYPAEGSRSYFCPPGEFIYGLSMKDVPNAFTKLAIYQPHNEYLRFGYFIYPTIRVDFYCKAMEPNSRVSLMDPDFYSAMNWGQDDGGETSPPPEEYACPSYAVGLNSRHHFYRDEWTGERLLHGEYTMHCSDGKNRKVVQHATEIHILILENTDTREHQTDFDCPRKYALCGIETMVEPKVPEQHNQNALPLELFKKFSFRSESWLHGFSKVFRVPPQGLYMSYICCPIPVLIVDKSCPNGVSYDIRPNEQKLKFCKEGVTTCEFGEIFGYTIKNETQVITDTYMQPHYPGYAQEVLASIGKATKKFLDTGFKQFLTLNQFTEPILEEEGTDLQGSRASEWSGRRQFETGNDKFFGKFMKRVGQLGELAENIGAIAGIPGLAIGIFNTFFGEEEGNAQLEAQLETNRILTDISSQLATMQSALVTTTAHHYSNVSTRTFAVGKGSGFAFYDMVLTCGDYSLVSDFNIEYITHSPDCEHNTLDRFKWQDVRFSPTSVDVNYTKIFSGYGTSIAGVSTENAIENVLPWNVLTRNGTLRNNLIKGGTENTHFSLVRAPLELFERANFTMKYLVNFVVPKNHLVAMYRVEITCKPWTVKTNDFYLRIGPVGSDFSEFDKQGTAGWTKYPPQGPLSVEPSPEN